MNRVTKHFRLNPPEGESMTRQEFVEAHRHVFGGMILDGTTAGHRGEALALFVRNIMRQVDARLGAAYDLMQQGETVPSPVRNGHTATPARK